MTFLNWTGKTTEESVAIKVYGYLLDPEHVNVRDHLTGKAAWFKNNLGFTRYNANALVKQIKFNHLRAKLEDLTEFGQKYREVIKILGANGKTKYIEFVWIKNFDGCHKISYYKRVSQT